MQSPASVISTVQSQAWSEVQSPKKAKKYIVTILSIELIIEAVIKNNKCPVYSMSILKYNSHVVQF